MESSKNKSPKLALLYYGRKTVQKKPGRTIFVGDVTQRRITILKQTHGGSCGSHSSGRSLAIRIKKLGYFWPTIADDSEQFALKCDKCQRHAPMIHQPTQKLSMISSPYLFVKWSMDIVGPLVPFGLPNCDSFWY